ncbi:MAG: PAS domain S-box protein [Lunatimonas sp.]|uniref:ATP-binding protein n=1 Tax=Lunatimonas sp. TaxID=2060141 RepID=UPI00263B288B|nr:ATP-binding protein [Lunatimonas sp.]MCC5938575.1 PAS domain S-box protein [Lunatimonas sp.]
MTKSLPHLLLLFWIVGSVHGQTFKSTKQIRGFEMSSENVMAIEQDHNGFVWIATDKVIKYSDGIKEESIPDSINHALRGHKQVLVDQDGWVWAYQARGMPRLFYMSEGDWHTVPVGLGVEAFSMAQPSIKMLVVGAGDSKQLNIAIDYEVLIQNLSGDLLFHARVDPDEAGRFVSFFISKEGVSYFLFEKGIYVAEQGSLEPISAGFGDRELNAVRVIHNEADGYYYYLEKNSLYRGKELWVADELVYSGFSEVINSVRDVSGMNRYGSDVYFFYNSQLFKVTGRSGRISQISVYDELKVVNVQSCMVDREGQVWIGTYRGMTLLESLRFQNFDKNVGLPETDISAIVSLGSGRYVLGYNNGLQVWEGTKAVKTITFSSARNALLSRVLNFTRDRFGGVWFSAYQAGVMRLDENSLLVKEFPLPSSIPVSYVEIDDDHLYVVCNEKVFKAKLGPSGLATPFEEDLLFLKEDRVKNFIRKIAKYKGKWLILDNDGVSDPQVLKSSEHHLRISGYDYLEKGDTLFIGKESGLFYVEGDSLKPYALGEVTFTNPVYALKRDASGAVWLGTNFGIIHLSSDGVRHFTERNGLIGNEVNRGALCLTESGRIFIGTQNGVSVYVPEEDYVRKTPPMTYLERITVISDYFTSSSTANIPYAYNNVQVEYRAISFIPWPRLTVSYMLKGLHSEWKTIENPRDNKLFLNNLPPGDYQLLLKSSLGGGLESDVVYSDPFKVDYPYYLQGWFIGIVVLLFVGLGILLNFLFVQYKYQDVLKSDLNQKTEEIQKTEDQFKNVWNSSEDGLMLSVVGGRVIAANPALCRMAGVNESELIENGLSYMFTDPAYYTKNRETVTKGVDKANGVTVEMTMPFKNGAREVEVYITRMQVDYEGKPFFLNIMKDITQKKEYQRSLRLAKERAEEVSRLKSSILSNMSHEIRTPLNGILGSAENILLNHQGNPDLLEQVTIIKESGDRLLQTINSILDLSKIQSDTKSIEFQEVNVDELLSKILLPHKAAAVKKGILLSVKYLARPFVAKIPTSVFEMIVNHIVSNAVKYSEKGMVTVWLDQNDGKLLLKVADQGIGIGKEYLDRLFVPFEQESKGYDRKFEGSGLGLAVTKHLLDQLSGTISIQSEKGVGTTVEIELPLRS